MIKPKQIPKSWGKGTLKREKNDWGGKRWGKGSPDREGHPAKSIVTISALTKTSLRRNPCDIYVVNPKLLSLLDRKFDFSGLYFGNSTGTLHAAKLLDLVGNLFSLLSTSMFRFCGEWKNCTTCFNLFSKHGIIPDRKNCWWHRIDEIRRTSEIIFEIVFLPLVLTIGTLPHVRRTSANKGHYVPFSIIFALYRRVYARFFCIHA